MSKLLALCLGLAIPLAAWGQDDPPGQDPVNPADRPLGDWITALKDKNRDTRRQAVVALAQFGPKAKQAVPDLIEAMADKDYLVRQGAATALARIGPEAKVALPTLNEALKDRNR